MNMLYSYFWKILGFELPAKEWLFVGEDGHIYCEIISTSSKQPPMINLDLTFALRTFRFGAQSRVPTCSFSLGVRNAVSSYGIA